MITITARALNCLWAGLKTQRFCSQTQSSSALLCVLPPLDTLPSEIGPLSFIRTPEIDFNNLKSHGYFLDSNHCRREYEKGPHLRQMLYCHLLPSRTRIFKTREFALSVCVC